MFTFWLTKKSLNRFWKYDMLWCNSILTFPKDWQQSATSLQACNLPPVRVSACAKLNMQYKVPTRNNMHSFLLRSLVEWGQLKKGKLDFT